jgi:hypothetical protein
MKLTRTVIAKIVGSAAFLLAGMVLLMAYRTVRAVASYGSAGVGIGALSSSQSAEPFGAIQGPFVINGVVVDLIPAADGIETLSRIVAEMLQSGWEKMGGAETDMDPDLLDDYRLLQKDNEVRMVMAMQWLGGVAVMTIPETEIDSLPVAARDTPWRDVPGKPLPYFPRPDGSRSVMNLHFKGGGHVTYQFPGDTRSEDVKEFMRAVSSEMRTNGWEGTEVYEAIGIHLMRRGAASCLIWSPPPVDGNYFVAALMTGMERE